MYLQAVLVELVQMAETPLYSAYCYAGRRVGHQCSLRRFLLLIDELLRKDVVRLWEVDLYSGDKSELFCVPQGLLERYRSMQELDEAFDPFGFTLTLGAGAEASHVPEWEVDLDMEHGRFVISSAPDKEEAALSEVGMYFPDVALVPERRDVVDQRVRLTGRIRRKGTA